MNSAYDLTDLIDLLRDVPVTRRVGRVARVRGGTLCISGIDDTARIGHRMDVRKADGGTVSGEIVQLLDDGAILLADGPVDGIALGDRAFLLEEATIAPCDAWIGRIVDPDGKPLDGRPLLRGTQKRSLHASPPAPGHRRPLGTRIETGLSVFNTVLPIVEGQRVGIFAGSGVGKSSLLGHFAKFMEADVVVLAMIGARGREVRNFVDQVLGREGRARTVIIAATSDRSPLQRRRCAWSAMAVAEHFRDLGKSVLLLADSITRFAEAHREVAVAAGEAPVLRGFPPSTSHQIMALCERAGPGELGQGDITGIFTVLVAGSDMEEPVADILRGVLDGHVVLDRSIAERGRYPAIDFLKSVSRSLPDAASEPENRLIGDVRRTLGQYDKNEMMISAGLYAQGSDPEIDRAITLWPDLERFLSDHSLSGRSGDFEKLAAILRAVPSKRPIARSAGPGRMP